MLDALGAPPLPHSPGRSFLGLVSDLRATPVWDDVAYSEYCADEYVPRQIDGGKTYQRMIRQDEWKLIYYHGMEPQLLTWLTILESWWTGHRMQPVATFVTS
ncbi:MAG: hypothetical protein R2867_28560 [Caldilineaceae bacterium]